MIPSECFSSIINCPAKVLTSLGTLEQYANRLHSIFSTGAVLTPGLATWLGEAFGPICQISFSGGTELCGSFLHGTRSLPSHPGEIAVKELGMDVDVFSPDGKSLPEGESGELVCKKPFPNMPVMFWNDPERKRYRSSYFHLFPRKTTKRLSPLMTVVLRKADTEDRCMDTWRLDQGESRHKGNLCSRKKVSTCLLQLTPRVPQFMNALSSDGVLNPSGIRFGSSEIYNILSTPPFTSSVLDALVVGQQRVSPAYSDSTERVLLFIKCSNTHSTGTLFPTQKLDALIRQRIMKDLSRRHVPEYIFEVEDVPYNANGKKMEIQVKAIVNGGASAKAKMKLSEQELAMMEKFERFYDLETLVKNSRRAAPKL